MIATRDLYDVEVTDAKGVIKNMGCEKFFVVAIRRNSKAIHIPTLMVAMQNLRDGLPVNGDNIHLKGMTIRRI